VKKINLISFEIKNFRSIQYANLDFSQGVVGLIGENASGKTNIVRAVEFLSERLKDSLPNGRVSGRVPPSIGATEWSPLQPDKHAPESILPRPKEGDSICLGLVAEVPGYVFDNKTHLSFGDEIESGESYILKLHAHFNCHSIPAGGLHLVPKYDIVINGRNINPNDINKLNALWGSLTTSRASLLTPFSQSFDELEKVRNSSPKGIRRHDMLNGVLCSLCNDFASLEFMGDRPVGLKEAIPDLFLENLSMGNIRAYQLLSLFLNPKYEQSMLMHIEEPETSFHPALQREVTRQLINERLFSSCNSMIIETHSPFVLKELYDNGVPVYQMKVVERDEDNGMRLSEAVLMEDRKEAARFLSEIGVENGFSLLGGIVVITDGPTDPPAYQALFSKFDELKELNLCFLPIGCLEAANFANISRICKRSLLIADGHFIEDHGERLRQNCEQEEIEYVQLQHWGVENFFSERVWREAEGEIASLHVDDALSLEPMNKIKKTPGLRGFSKSKHMAIVAPLMTKEELEQKSDFMEVVAALKKLGGIE
jgi:hypothetical protein